NRKQHENDDKGRDQHGLHHPRCAAGRRQGCSEHLKKRYGSSAFLGARAMLVTTFVIIFVLLAVSALFAGSETALTAVSRGRMHQLEKDGSRAAACVNRLVENRERLIGALLLGNTFINILASSLMTAALEDRLGHRTVA